ncbi:nuclear transport factor 2 family protein [Kitasatospora sp. CM 4170]|uniref:Nuclear transport factor 2 family protein n=1 Tax=Kitasatospora aburaviensis TaxID=67265 RepID=A0ABW1EQZ9_9ACTN|nr:nuclear transport factor 2 family protein [Kitasatospora sp. CM 4170]WNM44403.1 nuclear transport factor 2 family protein [Kitasatospora sp. CM 4170]
MNETTTVPLERLRADIEQFYARHMQLLDGGRAEEWAATFTEDGTFRLPGRPEPSRGRAELAEGARRARAAQEAAGETHRHWHGMLDVEARPDGSVSVRCYALVYLTPRGGEPRLHRACVCEDVLVRADGGWRVRTRVVTRDGH